MPPRSKNVAERFWPKVNIDGPNGCWLWTAVLTHDGYGHVSIGARGLGRIYAHRWAYEALIGPIPDGLQLDHLCRVRNCVNPAHLEPVTCRENASRTPRAMKTHCLNGHEFTEDNIKRTSRGTRSCRECSRVLKRVNHDVLPVCANCGLTVNRVRGGWRHSANAFTAGRGCGSPVPLLDDEPTAGAA